MARKSRKNVQATPAVIVDPVQYKVALYARISVENEQKREADTIGNQIALLKEMCIRDRDYTVMEMLPLFKATNDFLDREYPGKIGRASCRERV